MKSLLAGFLATLFWVTAANAYTLQFENIFELPVGGFSLQTEVDAQGEAVSTAFAEPASIESRFTVFSEFGRTGSVRARFQGTSELTGDFSAVNLTDLLYQNQFLTELFGIDGFAAAPELLAREEHDFTLSAENAPLDLDLFFDFPVVLEIGREYQTRLEVFAQGDLAEFAILDTGEPGAASQDLIYGADFQILLPQEFNPIPEPSTLCLLGIGILGVIGFGLKRRK